MDHNELIALLKREMVPALGVTEPSAIALACATAFSHIKGELEKIELCLDPGLFKNAYSCAVPGTTESGIEIAALLGILGENPSRKLEVLQDITTEQTKIAKKMKHEGLVTIQIEKHSQDLYINALVKTTAGVARTVIQGEHSNFTYIEVNGETILKKHYKATVEKQTLDISRLRIKDFLEFITKVPFTKIEFILEAITVNKQLMKKGNTGAGAGIGQGL